MRNRNLKSRMRTRIQRLRRRLEATPAGSTAAGSPREDLLETERVIRKAASQGVIPRRRASRSISRLHRAVRTALGAT